MENEVRLVENERSWAIELISEINRITNKVQLNIVKAGGETTINNSRSTIEGSRKIMFPDIILYGDSNKTKIIQGWEIKLPDIPVTDETYIKDAQYKADILKTDSTVLWNFNQAVLYVKKNHEWSIKKQWNNLANIKNRKGVEDNRIQWVDFLEKFILELNEFYSTGTITSKGLDEVSDSIMVQIIQRNKKLLSDSLFVEAASDRMKKLFIENWWEHSKLEYMHDEVNGFDAFAKNILLNWINRFTFANFIRYTHVSAKEIELVSKDMLPKEVNAIFKRITESADFYTIFESQDYNEIMPYPIWSDLVDYNSFLQDKMINHESLQKLLEGTVNTIRREVIGQYTTPPKLAMLLVRATMVDVAGDVIDPCCGTGTIPKAVTVLKEESRLSMEIIHQTTWASDKFSFPLQIANLALTSAHSMNLENKVFKENVFNLINKKTIEIRSPRNGKMVAHNIPKFKTILSNLPFVPFEIISDDDKLNLKGEDNKIRLNTEKQLSFDGRSDLYEYITIYLECLLDDNGRIGIILSNSWLASASGKNFYNLLLYYYDIVTIISSGNGRWFNNADVMSTILVLNKKEEKGVIQSRKIQFVLLKVPLESLNNDEITLIGDSILLRNPVEFTSINLCSIKEIEEILQYNLSLNALFYKVNWMNKIKDKIVPIKNIFNVIRGMRRGWDAMFYPTAGNKIEKKYLKRVLKSSKSIKTLVTHTDQDAFCCSVPIDELKTLGDKGTIEWISKFENGVNRKGKPLPQVLSSKNMQWYEMKEEGSIAEFVTSINPEQRLFWARLEEPSFINQRLTGLNKINPNNDSELLHALLNSILGRFFIESCGFGRGLGALDTSKDNIGKSYMLNPDLVSDSAKKNIIESFETVKDRPIQSTLLDIEDYDYQLFDKLVLQSFGIEEYYEQIKNSLREMINTRLSVK